jgi:hypothetical protein
MMGREPPMSRPGFFWSRCFAWGILAAAIGSTAALLLFWSSLTWTARSALVVMTILGTPSLGDLSELLESYETHVDRRRNRDG